MVGISCSSTSPTSGQKDWHFICRHTQGTIMGSLAQQFTNVVVVCEHIEQGVKSSRISAPIENRGFEWKEVNHIEDGYKGRKNLSQNYHTSSQIADIKKPEPQNFQAKSLLNLLNQFLVIFQAFWHPLLTVIIFFSLNIYIFFLIFGREKMNLGKNPKRVMTL